ncbi:MAG: hypothetical protein Q9220_001180 [cf. Caloplaca sp. 1 TL-2023]
MAKSRPSRKAANSREKRGSERQLDRVLPRRPAKKTQESVEDLSMRASTLIQTSQADEALPLVLRALDQLAQQEGDATIKALPALTLLAEIHLELGNLDTARDSFLRASKLDPDGSVPESQGGGVEKFLWLAQLSEEGGQDSVSWFEKGIMVLRNAIASSPDTQVEAQSRRKMAGALCAIVEIYMTDLSWEVDAEAWCESLITEAMLVAPDSPETLQTLASVRISQTRIEEAKKALIQSIDLWKDLPAENECVPDFPTRISLARLLMEVEMEDEALDVLERLVEEDDMSIEAWYLGGWCLYLKGERASTVQSVEMKDSDTNGVPEATPEESMGSSLFWLSNSLQLYELQEYEDERLRDHAVELVQKLDAKFGDDNEGDAPDDAEDGDWESEIEDDDQEMNGADG